MIGEASLNYYYRNLHNLTRGVTPLDPYKYDASAKLEKYTVCETLERLLFSW